ncbi:MAG TPA: hypothetical protein DFR83_19175, partial [Deltaproteobacteria bacterium]|nr:hypothetical protein [Deltaproteobacteria bacterium]
MHDQTSQFRAVLPAVCVGALVGLFERVAADSYGIPLETLLLPWGALLFAFGISRALPGGVVARPFTHWAGVGVSVALALTCGIWTDGLARLVGWLLLPRAGLPACWLGIAIAALWAPVRRIDVIRAHDGIVFCAMFLFGFVLPAPVVALLVGLGLLGAPQALPTATMPHTLSDR